LRKFLIVALAAIAAIAFAAVSFAQSGSGATLDTVLTPKDAGTKAKPTHSLLDLEVVNGDNKRTMSDLDIYMPKNLKVSLKGLPSCAPDVIARKQCPKSTVLGRGEARALAGVNGAAPLPLEFIVTAFKTKSPVTGKDMLGFFIDGPESLDFLTETQLKKASGKYGQRLHIDVPEAAQRTGATSYNGLVSLSIENLGKKKGSNMLLGSIGCANKKHPFKVVLTFIDNGVSPAGKIEKTDTSACKK
jgi:hypothetical protein